MQNTIKLLLIAISAAVIGYMAWTVYGEGVKPASARMSESVQMTQAQAQNMNQSLMDVSTIGEAGQSVGSQVTAPSQVNTPSIVNTPIPVSVAEITSLDDLLAEWRPRYATVKLARTKFVASIANAKSLAAQYFAQQEAITERMRDPNNRAKAQLEDESEKALYLQWEARADAALKSTDKIVIQLDDMDSNLRKMELRADFVFDASEFNEIPTAIDGLGQQLSDFQVASENIKLAVGSPFEVQQP